MFVFGVIVGISLAGWLIGISQSMEERRNEM